MAIFLREFLTRLAVSAITIVLLVVLLPGIRLGDNSLGTLIIVALVFGVVNAILKPALSVVTCPLIVLTLGLIFLLINALMLQVTAWLAGDRLVIDNFLWALGGGVVMAIVGIVTERILDKKEFTVQVDDVPDAEDILARKRAELDRDFLQNAPPPPPGQSPDDDRPRSPFDR
jgi:putative membrane protein